MPRITLKIEVGSGWQVGDASTTQRSDSRRTMHGRPALPCAHQGIQRATSHRQRAPLHCPRCHDAIRSATFCQRLQTIFLRLSVPELADQIQLPAVGGPWVGCCNRWTRGETRGCCQLRTTPGRRALQRKEVSKWHKVTRARWTLSSLGSRRRQPAVSLAKSIGARMLASRDAGLRPDPRLPRSRLTLAWANDQRTIPDGQPRSDTVTPDPVRCALTQA
jgi:hypothetical protein